MLKHFLLGFALTCSMVAFATEGVSEMAAQLFGTEEASKRISEGAVFIDGLYIRGPYSVTREGNVILINGRIASRFKVESAAAAEATAEESEEPASEEGNVSEEEGEAIGGSDEMPSLPSTPAKATKQPSKVNLKGKSLAEREAEKKKAAALKAEASKGSFNQTASTADPMALFEEADYTYTPPQKPEAPAVPYVRPAQKKSINDRMADMRKQREEAKQKEAEKAAAEAAEGDAETASEDAVAVEDFESLTEEEIENYIKTFTERRAEIEKTLSGNGMVFLNSATSGIKTSKRSVMWRFVQQLDELCKSKDAKLLQAKWGKEFPRTYLQRIYDNRVENATNMKTFILRVKREEKQAKEKQKNRR